MPIIVKRKNEITQADLSPFNSEWIKGWEEWVVIDDYIVYDSYDTEEDANKIAGFLEKAKQTIEDIENYADEKISELTMEEIEFLRKYAGGTIQIEI